MTLDASKPAETSFGSELPAIERETRQEINEILASIGALGAVSTKSDVVLSVGQATLVTGVDVSAVGFEFVFLSAGAAETLTNITGGSHGQVKFIIFEDSNVTFEKNVTKFMLNSLDDLTGDEDDILVLINRGGIPGSAEGKWIELHRQIRID